MGMTRQERIALHKKQDRTQLKVGVPDINELKEGASILRATTEGIVEYVNFKGELYKKVLEKG